MLWPDVEADRSLLGSVHYRSVRQLLVSFEQQVVEQEASVFLIVLLNRSGLQNTHTQNWSLAVSFPVFYRATYSSHVSTVSVIILTHGCVCVFVAQARGSRTP